MAKRWRCCNSSESEPNWRAVYPFVSHYLSFEQVRMHFVDEGTGHVLLMVHGNPTWSFFWRRLIRDLRDRYRIVAPDHIGCGLSDKPQRYPYRLADRIEDLVRLIEALELDELTILGHDWGGAIGLGAALRIPKQVRRVVIFNSGAFPPPYVPWPLRFCRLPGIGTLAIRGGNLFVRGALRWAVVRPQQLDPAVRAGYLAPYNNWWNRVAVDRFVQDIPLSQRHPTWQTLKIIEAGLPFLANRPICILWGMRDWCFTEVCLSRFRDLFPEAEVHCLPEAGHWLVEDAPDEVLDRLRSFLEATD